LKAALKKLAPDARVFVRSLQRISMTATGIAKKAEVSKRATGIGGQFSKMYARKAFVHWYGGEGMENVEFDEARSNMVDLIHEYAMFETGGAVKTREREADAE
jgi:tubulin beta